MLDILLYSPLDPTLLAMTIQSIYVTCPYSDKNIFVGARSLDAPDLSSMESPEYRFISCEDSPRVFIHRVLELDDSDRFVFVPPGTIFLKESWIEDLRTDLGFERNYTLDNGETIPNIEAPFIFSRDLLTAIQNLEDVPDWGIPWIFLQRAREGDFDTLELTNDWYHIYFSAPSCVPPGPDLEQQKKRTIAITDKGD